MVSEDDLLFHSIVCLCQYSITQGRKAKYRVPVKELIDIICKYGLPPSKKNGSRTTEDGYWTRVCRELSGRKNPSLAFIKVVYSYWMKDLHQVKSCRVEDKLLSESEV